MIHAVTRTSAGMLSHKNITPTPKAMPGTDTGSSTTYSRICRPAIRVRAERYAMAMPRMVAMVAEQIEIQTLLYRVNQTSLDPIIPFTFASVNLPDQT